MIRVVHSLTQRTASMRRYLNSKGTLRGTSTSPIYMHLEADYEPRAQLVGGDSGAIIQFNVDVEQDVPHVNIVLTP